MVEGNGIQIFPGRRGDIEKERASNDYGDGRVSFVSGGKAKDYSFPFGNPSVDAKEVSLYVYPLTLDIFGVYYSFHGYPRGGEITGYTSQAKDYIRNFNDEERRRFISFMHYHLENIGDTMRGEMKRFRKSSVVGLPSNLVEYRVLLDIDTCLPLGLKNMILENPELEVEYGRVGPFDKRLRLKLSGKTIESAVVEVKR